MSFNAPSISIRDPNTGNAMGITSVGAISVNTVNISSTTVVGGSIVVTAATISGGSITVTGGIAGSGALSGVSLASVALTTAFVTVDVNPGRLFGVIVATTGGGPVSVNNGSGGQLLTGLVSGNPQFSVANIPAAGIPYNSLVVNSVATSGPTITITFA